MPAPAPSAEIEAACDACDRALLDAELRVEASRERGHALLEAIYADPADHGSRAVYADWLLERGDPRGELIALQLLRDHGEPQRARMLELEAAPARAWLGPIAEACTAVWFDAGFPVGGVVDAERLIACRDAPEWRTFRALTFARAQAIPLELIGAPTLRNLRFLGGVAASSIYAIRRQGHDLPITGLGVASEYGLGQYELSRLYELAAHLGLDELGFDNVPRDRFASLFAYPEAPRITRLRLRPQADMVALIETLPGHVTTVELAAADRTGWAFTWSRRAVERRWSRLAIEHRPTATDVVAPVGALATLVGALPDDQLEACALRLIGSRAGRAELAALAAALARQTRMAELALPAR